MPMLTVTGGPTPPAGRSLAAGSRLTVRYERPYSDGVFVFPVEHWAAWDPDNDRWRPESAPTGTAFELPGGGDGWPRPPVAHLLEELVLDDGSEVTTRRSFRIVETTAGAWEYGGD